MYLKTKFRKRNRLAGHKSRKYRRRRSIKKGGAPYNIECTTDKDGKVCCVQNKEGLPKNKEGNITPGKLKNNIVENKGIVSNIASNRGTIL